ncbi:MAG: single-strand selective monofunctional uracil-DNA glycosylase [Verrucomicrobia bacterium]|nr:MAG: single-strand selective monofunctional uracil-DNA glycosylase [Verrucomicrobiota bacterium]
MHSSKSNTRAASAAGGAAELITAAAELRDAVSALRFSKPVTHTYNPLDYAWPAHRMYLENFGGGRKKILFLGMNPGPFGMAQTGVPFGEIAAVRDWLGISAPIGRPAREHPKRLITGFDCDRSEVSGARLWSLFRQRFGTPQKFFRDHFVANYCPLAFLSETGSNLTPDKIAAKETRPLFAACDEHLRRVVKILRPEWLIGVGGFAQKRAQEIFTDGEVQIGVILHPSPASPAANRDWAGKATRQLIELGVW